VGDETDLGHGGDVEIMGRGKGTERVSYGREGKGSLIWKGRIGD
jgi:hypothetical protein